jgi:transposase-like protein
VRVGEQVLAGRTQAATGKPVVIGAVKTHHRRHGSLLASDRPRDWRPRAELRIE